MIEDVKTLHQRDGRVSWQRYLDGVGDDQWDLPTPCTEAYVRALVNHVVGEERCTGPLLDGMTIAEVGDRFAGDLLGDDKQAAGRAASADAVGAVDGQARRHRRRCISPTATRTLREYVRQLGGRFDHLIHPAGTSPPRRGQDRILDAELVAEVAAWFADRQELYRSAGVVGQRAEGGGGDPQVGAALPRIGPIARIGQPTDSAPSCFSTGLIEHLEAHLGEIAVVW